MVDSYRFLFFFNLCKIEKLKYVCQQFEVAKENSLKSQKINKIKKNKILSLILLLFIF